MPLLFTTEEYADMVFILGVCDGNATAAAAEYQRRFPNRRVPNPKTISGTFHTLRETGTLPSISTHHNRPAQNYVNMEETIIVDTQRSPGVSIRRLSKRFVVSQSMVWRILCNNNMSPYHKQKVQNIQPTDPPLRLEFCNWLIMNRQLHRFILFTDEAQFTRDGINNLRNQHTWAEDNPHSTIERNFQQRFSVNVWCGLLYDQLIGPFILPGHLNSNIYLEFLKEQLPQLLEDVPLASRYRMYYQHDGAPAHFSRAVSVYLNEQFPERWIGRGGPQTWPPRSPDLTPLDFCVWGWMKSIVYEKKVNTREELLDRIADAATRIKNNRAPLRRATRTIRKRAAKCIEVQGQIFENLL